MGRLFLCAFGLSFAAFLFVLIFVLVGFFKWFEGFSSWDSTYVQELPQ